MSKQPDQEEIERERRKYERHTAEFERQVIEFQRHMRIVDEVKKQTDRGAAIVCAEWLSERLKDVLEVCFVRESNRTETIERLFGGTYGALESFAARTDLAFALGLIGPTCCNDLKYIRKIRNEFAHTADPLTFESGKIPDLCKNLRLPAADVALPLDPEHLQEVEVLKKSPPPEPRAQFLEAVSTLLGFLLAAKAMRSKTDAAPLWGIP